MLDNNIWAGTPRPYKYRRQFNMKPESKKYSTTLGNNVVTFETGKLAGQAGGAVTFGTPESIVFAAATMGGVREGIDFFPLQVEYEERLYAGGRIPGSFFRREGRPGTDAILTARLTDRPLRPLFQDGMRNEVQVIMFSLSSDGMNPLDVLAINAASAAIMISDIPWNGPVGAVRVGRVNGEFVINPTFTQIDASDLDLRIAGTRDAILMVECGANEIPEDVMVAALELGHKSMQPLIDLQYQMQQEVGKAKREVAFAVPDPELKKKVFDRVSRPMNELLGKPLSKNEFYGGMTTLKDALVLEMCTVPEGANAADYPTLASVREAFDQAEQDIVRERILSQGKRPDGRTPTDIRPIWCEVGISPRAHGSGLFTRGETQILSVATLATLGEAQELDNLSPNKDKRYLHHYNFPPYSTGEAKPLRGQSRREIGHGALAERALEPVIPAEESFPYMIRVVSEALSSNGSTSMGSVCGSTLALMEAGVPIKEPVGGIAMGLVKEGEDYVILTDIQGAEDHLGDMDFKVAGTRDGVTALQMDIKITGVTQEIMERALAQAKEARAFILDKMLEAIPEVRSELNENAPRISTVKIDPEKIGMVIGKGGETIRGLESDYDVQIDIEEDGTILIYATDGPKAEAAIAAIEALTKEPEVGDEYTGKVVKTTDFGAFVELKKGTDGLLHVSNVGPGRVAHIEDVISRGDVLDVQVAEVDKARGRIGLKLVAKHEDGKLIQPEEIIERAKSAPPREREERPRNDDRRGGRDRGRRDRGPRRES